MECKAAVVIFVLFHCANSVQIQTQSTSTISESVPIHKRSAAIVQFFMNSDSRNQLLKGASQPQEVEPVNEQDLLCPREVSTEIDDPVRKLSLCPWYYSVSRDLKRFPAVVMNAEPLCEYAIGSNVYECVPITQSMLVFKQENNLDEEGNYVWVEDTITIVTGYTAAARRIGDNSQITTAAPNNQSTPEWAKR